MTPRLSVIIPTYNRAWVVRRCLDALLAQTLSRDAYEVIVADDGSPDETRAVAEEYAKRWEGVRYLHQQNSGANAARNRAIRASRGAILLFINDDTIATPEMLAEHLRGHDEHPEDRFAVLGRVTVSRELPFSRLAPLHLDRAYESLGGVTEHDWRAFFTCNVSVKASLLARGGMFEERIRYHEDLELGERLSREGLRVIYRPAALGYHDHYLTEKEFLGIAAREARAVATWSRISPDLAPTLATLGYEPAQPLRLKLRNRVADAVVNRVTMPVLRVVARYGPMRIALPIYNQIYRASFRSALRRELRGEGGA